MKGYTTNDPQEVNTQPVSITSVDVSGSKACGQTRQGNIIWINTIYHVGAVSCVPAIGDQWYITRHRGEWRLLSRIPFQTDEQLRSPTQGQTQIGSSGPTELNGSVVNINSDTMTLNGVAYRDNGSGLQRQNADGSWSTIGESTTIPSTNITDATVLGKLLLTAPDVNTVLSILGLAVAASGIDGGTSTSTLVDPIVSGGTVSGPNEGADLDGGRPESAGDTFVTGGTP
jgi:hypothetical protein